MATQAQSQGRYAVVNTLLDTTDVTLIDSLSGRQGDNGRIVYFAIKDGNLPHNLDGQNVVLTAKDSAGKVKQISGVHDMISATGGLFSMLIPGEMYQSAGEIGEAYLSVQDGAGTVISSIPVTFTVLANNILFTANASKDYIDSVQNAVDEANSRISGLNDNIKAQQLAYETLKTSVENLAGQIDSKQVAMLNVENNFTETATFTKGLNTNGLKVSGDDYQNLASTSVNYFGATISFVRIGKLVTFTSVVSAFNATVPIGLTSNVIPNGFKPTLQQNVRAASQSGSAKFFSFDDAGAIYSYESYSSGDQPRLSGTYITTDAWPE
ncbi:BppU family phage baseplate upper protein [Weissella confusa]|uniref:BppU family phage baseplate upper protein n=2 Tax=Weissella confusa TaxID=1583 RepID=UPI0018F182A3|nr:BppU family phage baseplate upper protein [Weissella confusa]MBJ7640792.1 BppU family phage baseplate upper protein [Weissella confusa]